MHHLNRTLLRINCRSPHFRLADRKSRFAQPKCKSDVEIQRSPFFCQKCPKVTSFVRISLFATRSNRKLPEQRRWKRHPQPFLFSKGFRKDIKMLQFCVLRENKMPHPAWHAVGPNTAWVWCEFHVCFSWKRQNDAKDTRVYRLRETSE